MQASFYSISKCTCTLQAFLLQDPTFDGRDAIRRARDKVLAREEYQTELPGDFKLDFDESSFDSIIQVFAFLVKAGFIMLVVAGIVLIIRAIVDRRSSKRLGSRDRNARKAQIRGEQFTVDMSEIHAMASDGRYGAAIHALLLGTLHELCRLAELDLPQAMTSREILAEIPLEGEPQANLGALVKATEISHFGGVDPTEEEYHACLNHFQKFVISLGGNVS